MATEVKTTIGCLFGELSTLHVINSAARSRLLKLCHSNITNTTNLTKKLELVKSLGIAILTDTEGLVLKNHTKISIVVRDILRNRMLGPDDLFEAKGCRTIWKD